MAHRRTSDGMSVATSPHYTVRCVAGRLETAVAPRSFNQRAGVPCLCVLT